MCSYPPQSGSETGSDDGVVYNSVPIVSPSQETIRLSNEDRRSEFSLSITGLDIVYVTYLSLSLSL